MGRLIDESDAHAAWQRALALWGVSFHEPVDGSGGGSFAWFGFPPEISVDPRLVRRMHLRPHLESVYAHELGHHVLAPGTRLDALKIAHQVGRALLASGADRADVARVGRLANLWEDLLINVRVAERQAAAGEAEPDMVSTWRQLSAEPTADPMWWVVLRAYELLWRLPDGTLCAVRPPAMTGVAVPSGVSDPGGEAATVEHELADLTAADPAVDALLLADTVRTFGRDPIGGALPAAMLLAPYLLRAAEEEPPPAAACGGYRDAAPATAEELERIRGDPRLAAEPTRPGGPPADDSAAGAPAAGQGYGVAETLRLFPGSDPQGVMTAWYATAARRYLLPVVQRGPRRSGEELPGALDEWLPGDEVARIDWPATLTRGPVVVPGVTTLQRATELDAPPPDAEEPVELELYVDSSGSMQAPARGSPAVLAGAVLVLSVLRSGGRVRVTSFSGPGQVAGSDRPTRDRTVALRDLLTFFGGGTTFPIDLFAARARGVGRARRHLVVLSDDGLLSMFGEGQPEAKGVAAAVRTTFATAVLVLLDAGRTVEARATAAGYEVRYLRRMEDAPGVCARIAHRIAAEGARG